jgi:hypothetical protein
VLVKDEHAVQTGGSKLGSNIRQMAVHAHTDNGRSGIGLKGTRLLHKLQSSDAAKLELLASGQNAKIG